MQKSSSIIELNIFFPFLNSILKVYVLKSNSESFLQVGWYKFLKKFVNFFSFQVKMGRGKPVGKELHSRAKVWNHLHEVVSTRSCVITNLLVTKKVAPF